MQEILSQTELQEKQNGEAKKPLRRSIVAILLGCVLICFCLWFFAAYTAFFWDPPNSPFGVAGVFPGTLLLWYAFRQYRLLFCCEPWEMHSISGCFIVVGILLSPLAIIIFDRANVDWSEFAVLLAFPVISLTFGFISVINNTQRGLVRGSGPELFSKHPSFLKRYWKRDLIGLLVMGLILMGIMAYEISKIPPVYAKNVSYEQMFHQVRSRFPKEGRDFCYFRGGRGSMVCEFTIDEQGFRNWITSDKSWGPCYPIKKDVQVEILPPSAFETGKRDWEENVKRPTITDGLHTSFGDKHIGRAVFDRTTNRVYYWYY